MPVVGSTSPQHKPQQPVAAVHNAALQKAQQRSLDLEAHLVRLLVPLFVRAGRVAASHFERWATRHVAASAALTAAIDVRSNSTMVCVKPRPEQAQAIADDDGYPADVLHCTLVYLGEIDGPLDHVRDALAAVAAAHGPLAGVVGGYGQFDTPGGAVGVLLPDVPGLVELRVAVTETLVEAGIEYARSHGFEAHITVDDEAEPDELAKMLARAGSPLNFDDLLLVRGDTEVVPLPLVGRPPLTASAALTAAGSGDDFCLPREIRTRTDAVMGEVVNTVAGATLEPLGLSWDVTNPYIEHVTARIGKQVTEISKTVQQDVMKVVHDSYKSGLSVPETAKAIQQKMTGAAFTRATLIARTELAGAVNGASLASMQTVASELSQDGGDDSGGTGGGFGKEWLTAPGAMHPRHETYDDLDGQTRALDEPFDVGDSQLMYPGDPDGDPAEVCNCRCSVIYSDGSEGDSMEGSVAASGGSTSPGSVGASPTPGPPLAARGTLADVQSYARAMTAAGEGGWSAPAPQEVLNVACDSAPAANALPTAMPVPKAYEGGDLAAAPRMDLSDRAILDATGDNGFLSDPNWYDEEVLPIRAELEGALFKGAWALPENKTAQYEAIQALDRMGYDDVRALYDDNENLLGIVDFNPVPTETELKDAMDHLEGWAGDAEEEGDAILMSQVESAMKALQHDIDEPRLNFGVNHLASVQPGVGTRLMREVAKEAAAQGKGIGLDSLDGESAAFYEKLGMEPNATYPSNFYFTPSQTKEFAQGKPVTFAPEAPEEALLPETPVPAPAAPYDVALLPQWAQTPLEQLTPAEAAAERKKLIWARNSLNQRLKKLEPGTAKHADVQAKLDAANQRIDHLKGHATGTPVVKPVAAPPVLPEPTVVAEAPHPAPVAAPVPAAVEPTPAAPSPAPAAPVATPQALTAPPIPPSVTVFKGGTVDHAPTLSAENLDKYIAEVTQDLDNVLDPEVDTAFLDAQDELNTAVNAFPVDRQPAAQKVFARFGIDDVSVLRNDQQQVIGMVAYKPITPLADLEADLQAAHDAVEDIGTAALNDVVDLLEQQIANPQKYLEVTASPATSGVHGGVAARLMDEVAKAASLTNDGVVVTDAPAVMQGFYKSIGMEETAPGAYRWTAEQAKAQAEHTLVVKPTPSAPPEPANLPPPPPASEAPLPPASEVAADRPFSHWADATVSTQLNRSRKIVRDLEESQKTRGLTAREQHELDQHRQRAQQILAEREFRKANKGAARPAKQMSRSTSPYGALSHGESIGAASRAAAQSSRQAKPFLNPSSVHSERQNAKDAIMRTLSDRVENDPAWRRTVQYMQANKNFYYSDVQNATASQQSVSQVIQTWAGSSDSDVVLSQVVQRAATEEFGLSDPASSMRRASPHLKERVNDMYNEIGPGVRVLLREMYNHTQEELARAGMKEVTLYRGMGNGPSGVMEAKQYGKPVQLKLQPASSFASDPDVARRFAGSGQRAAIYAATVPASRVLGTARTGFGCLHETEFVVLGEGRGDTAWAVGRREYGMVSRHGGDAVDNYWLTLSRAAGTQ